MELTEKDPFVRKFLIAALITVGLLLALAVALVVNAMTGREEVLATVGGYEITEKTLKNYVAYACACAKETGEDPMEVLIQEYAKARLAESEIADTAYALSPVVKNVLRKKEIRHFEQNYEACLMCCKQHGLSQTDLIEARTTFNWNAQVKQQHMQWFFEKYQEKLPSGDSAVALEETGQEAYDRYVAGEIDNMVYIPLQEEKMQKLAESLRICQKSCAGTDTTAARAAVAS